MRGGDAIRWRPPLSRFLRDAPLTLLNSVALREGRRPADKERSGTRGVFGVEDNKSRRRAPKSRGFGEQSCCLRREHHLLKKEELRWICKRGWVQLFYGVSWVS